MPEIKTGSDPLSRAARRQIVCYVAGIAGFVFDGRFVVASNFTSGGTETLSAIDYKRAQSPGFWRMNLSLDSTRTTDNAAAFLAM
jgi:hypothetical protein